MRLTKPKTPARHPDDAEALHRASMQCGLIAVCSSRVGLEIGAFRAAAAGGKAAFGSEAVEAITSAGGSIEGRTSHQLRIPPSQCCIGR
jgi:hypothetical protein